jgi:hypothetical protein
VLVAAAGEAMTSAAPIDSMATKEVPNRFAAPAGVIEVWFIFNSFRNDSSCQEFCNKYANFVNDSNDSRNACLHTGVTHRRVSK